MGHLFNVEVSTVWYARPFNERLFDICNEVIPEYIAHQLWKKWVNVRNAIKLLTLTLVPLYCRKKQASF